MKCDRIFGAAKRDTYDQAKHQTQIYPASYQVAQISQLFYQFGTIAININ